MSIQRLLIFMLFLTTIVAFQNCGGVKFGKDPDRILACVTPDSQLAGLGLNVVSPTVPAATLFPAAGQPGYAIDSGSFIVKGQSTNSAAYPNGVTYDLNSVNAPLDGTGWAPVQINAAGNFVFESKATDDCLNPVIDSKSFCIAKRGQLTAVASSSYIYSGVSVTFNLNNIADFQSGSGMIVVTDTDGSLHNVSPGQAYLFNSAGSASFVASAKDSCGANRASVRNYITVNQHACNCVPPPGPSGGPSGAVFNSPSPISKATCCGASMCNYTYTGYNVSIDGGTVMTCP